MTDRLLPPGAAAAGITIVRVFDATRGLVWREWTEPQRFADWFGGPGSEVPVSTVSMDLRPGGAWSATTLGYGPDRRDVVWRGEYLEIIEPERLTFTICGVISEPDVVTVVLTDLGDGHTEMLFRQRGGRTPTEYDHAGDGWSREFDRIAEQLRKHGISAPT